MSADFFWNLSLKLKVKHQRKSALPIGDHRRETNPKPVLSLSKHRTSEIGNPNSPTTAYGNLPAPNDNSNDHKGASGKTLSTWDAQKNA